MKKLILATLAVCSFNTFADIDISAKNTRETFTNTVKVSGNFHLGVQYEGSPDLDNLHVNIPSGSEGLLCVKLASIDGKYKAELRHTLDGNESGLVKINFDSKYKGKLKDLNNNELAVLAMIGSNCQSSQSSTLISSWSSKTDKLVPVLLIRSDARKDEVHAPSISNAKHKVKCQKFTNTQKVTFDKYCSLKGIDLNEFSTFEVERKHFRKMKNERITLSL